MSSGNIDIKTVEEIAKLAKLEVSKEEKEKFAEQFSKTIRVVEQLQEIETDGVEPTAQVTGLTNVWREDEIDESRILTQEEALSGAKRTHNGYFVVGRLIET